MAKKVAVIDRLLAAFVSSPDMMRRIEHTIRLMDLNGHEDTSETFRLLTDLVEARRAAQREENPDESQ